MLAVWVLFDLGFLLRSLGLCFSDHTSSFLLLRIESIKVLLKSRRFLMAICRRLPAPATGCSYGLLLGKPSSNDLSSAFPTRRGSSLILSWWSREGWYHGLPR